MMRMTEGVEWGLHCCLTLAWIGPEQSVSTARLAAWFDLPPAYLNKRLQALVRAGLLSSTPGVHGGFRLARAPEQVTLMDVVAAVEGRDDVFRCTEIRQQGQGSLGANREFAAPCGVAAAMHRAELAWRAALAAQTLADLMAAAPPDAGERTRHQYARLHD